MDVFGVQLEKFCDRLDAIEGRLGVLEGLNPGHRPLPAAPNQGEDPPWVSNGGQPQRHRSEDDEVDPSTCHQGGGGRTLAGPPPTTTKRIHRRATREEGGRTFTEPPLIVTAARGTCRRATGEGGRQNPRWLAADPCTT
ncbi:hypothetical protein GUJ93_ZPchr0006g43452 [Zizania palustris]|nr:hypothetical protein GUJ93_ZPchr0006g43452 [Zizania palustris]